MELRPKWNKSVFNGSGSGLKFLKIITARRNGNARIASAVLATAILSVRLSVTRRYCVKTTARNTMQFALSIANCV